MNEKNAELKCDEEQYKFLIECAEKNKNDVKGKAGIKEWNKWREENPEEEIFLEGADLKRAHFDGGEPRRFDIDGMDLKLPYLGGTNVKNEHPLPIPNAIQLPVGINLRGAHLRGAKSILLNLKGANLAEAHLEDSHLCEAHLEGADLSSAHFKGAYMKLVHLEYAQLLETDLRKVDLSSSHLNGAWLFRTRLEDSDLNYAYIRGSKLEETHLEGATMNEAHLENTDLRGAYLKGANLMNAYLEGASMQGVHLESANFRKASVDGNTLIWEESDDKNYRKVDRRTDFRGVPLDNCRIESGMKILLEYNNRRLNWWDWYDKGNWFQQVLKKIFVRPFWWVSDYGHRTGRVLSVFLLLSVLFAFIYHRNPEFLVYEDKTIIEPSPLYSFYFSIVTMTTLGFGDVAASPNSWQGQVLLIFHVSLGYVILGALITRLTILFTAGGPSAKFVKRSFRQWLRDGIEELINTVKAIWKDFVRWCRDWVFFWRWFKSKNLR